MVMMLWLTVAALVHGGSREPTGRPEVAPMAQLAYHVDDHLAECPDEQRLRTAVAARLGRNPFAPRAPTQLTVRIARIGSGAGLEATLSVTTSSGTRRRVLESPTGDCLELATSIELALSLAIDPLSLTRPVTRPVEREVVPEPATPPPLPVAKAEPPMVKASPIEFAARAGVLGTAGAVPGFAGGIIVGASLEGERWSIGLEARTHLPTAVVTEFSRSTVLLSLFGVLPCVRLSVIRGCIELAVGPFQLESSNADVARVTTLMAQSGLRLEGLIELSKRWRVVPWLETMVVLTRTSLVSKTQQQTLWVSWPLSVSGGALVEAHF